MEKTFTANTTHNVRRFFVLLLLALGTQLRAQEATFLESFDTTPAGEVPEGWKWYSLGGDRGNNWVRSSYGLFGPKVMFSGVEYALPGQLDEDWLVTPQITPAPGDKLIFDSGQEYTWFDYGATFKVLISTTTANRDAFTEELASYTESEFPGYLYDTPLTLDLTPYEGMPIYIAFVHVNPVEAGDDPDNPPPTDNWYLDNVAVRQLQPLEYTAGEIYWSYDHVIRVAQSSTSVIIGIVIRTAGDEGAANLSSVTFTTEGSIGNVAIKEARLYTTYGDSFISTDDDNVSADLFGSIPDPSGEFTIEGNQDLGRGDTYFWLMYVLEASDEQLTYPYPEVDATFESVNINGVTREATVSSVSGAHAVVPSVPINDNYADAIEIAPSAVPTRYGSYNYKATFETEFDQLAYCAEPAMDWARDGANSVWWYFKAPAFGRITIDLSESNFNTLLVIKDKNNDQLACNKDIDETSLVFQSRISDFEVEKDQELFIRVTGEANGPGDPNAANGVVHMSFSFVTPVGIESPAARTLSTVYPNPANNIAYVDVMLQKSSEVVLDVVDFVGKPVMTKNAGRLAAGAHHNIAIDIAALPAGPYVVRLRGSDAAQTQKMIVLK